MSYAFFVDGFEETEAFTTLDILRRAGIEIKSVSLTDNKFVSSNFKIKVETDLLFSEIKADCCDFIFLPGGGGTKNYNNYPDFLDFVKNHVNKGKITCAICAAPTILAGLGLLEGKNATCYPSPFLMEILSENKANYVDEDVVIDGNLITSKGPGTTPVFALKIIEALKGLEAACSVKEAFLL